MITLVRVDNRLLHGQILEAWVPRLEIEKVTVADDAAAASPLALAALNDTGFCCRAPGHNVTDQSAVRLFQAK